MEYPSFGSEPKETNEREVYMQYPETPEREVIDELHGERVSDSYRWLEDESNTEVRTWVEKQNELTENYLESINAEPVYQEILRDYDVFDKSTPYKRGDRYFWWERQPGQQHHVLFSVANPDTEKDKKEVFDVNEMSEDGTTADSFFNISRRGSYAVYGLMEQGDEYNRVFIRDMENGNDEEFYYGRIFLPHWRDDESGFYYTRSNYEAHGGDSTDETHYQQIYFHKLGENREDDHLIFDAIDYLPKEAFVTANDSEDNRYVAVNASIGSGGNEQYVYLFDTQNEEIKEIAPGIEAHVRVRIFDGYAYLYTNYEANNYRILRIPVEEAGEPLEKWEEYVPEDQSRQLKGWALTKREILAIYMYNATDKVDRLDRQSGSYIAPLDIPEFAGVGGLPTDREEEDFYYSVNTFFSPRTQYYFNPETKNSELFYEDPISLDKEKHTVEQRWYTSNDGESIPMFFVAPRNYVETENNPVLLTGYGGFNSSRKPHFVGNLKPWLERGGIIAEPNLRGGGEFGEEWHEAGMRENKQNTFNDFISAAEYLIEEGVTRSGKIAIRGGSNGGLLIGASITQRPDLFKAAICNVPLLDMYRYHKFLMAHRWTHEYGNPDNKKEFAWLKDYSPYHHVDDNKKYPDILLTAGINDSRVHPMHAWKMAAKLQNGHSENVALLRTEMAAGHGPGKGFYSIIHDFAEELAFMMHQVGMSTDATV